MPYTKTPFYARPLDWLVCHAARWEHRFGEILRAPVQLWSEVVIIGFMAWQTWRFAVLIHWLPVPLKGLGQRPGGLQNAAGTQLTAAVHDLWQALLGQTLPYVTGAIFLVGLLSLIGLMEQKTALRWLGVSCSLCWLVWSAFMLTVHTPEHLSGGVNALLAFLATAVFVQISVLWGQENEARMDRVAAWIMQAGRALPLGQRPRRSLRKALPVRKT